MELEQLLLDPRDVDDAQHYNGSLFVALTGVAVGGMIASCGVGRLFARGGAAADGWEMQLALGGATLGLISALLTAWLLRKMPATHDDCTLYGRHIVGLTFILLVTGLCNSVATSTLAFEGVLEFSAARLIEASKPEVVQARRDQHDAAVSAEKKAAREARTGEVARVRAKAEQATACSNGVSGASLGLDATPAAVACQVARQRLIAAEDSVTSLGYAVDDAQEQTAKTMKECDESRRSLFFLLSVSTMMSLFGAAFYVVNRVRMKRPRLTGSSPSGNAAPAGVPGEDSFDSIAGTTTVTATATLDPAKAASGVSASAAAAPASKTENGPSATSAAWKMTARASSTADAGERFDVHAFWSGAFFRIGEAVLFTFAFFWLIWTSSSSTLLIWLPVLALFVGMFVKTGETIVFRLGMRILSAAEALLPAGPTAIRVEEEARSGPSDPEPKTPPKAKGLKSANGAGDDARSN